VFVTEGESRYRGYVNLDDVPDAVKRGDPDLRKILRDNTPTARGDQCLDELLTVVADSRLPIPVLDDERRLLGELTRQRTLSALAGDCELETPPSE
jgi:glycine betaine/proline transport system ATP-binding protein